MKTISLWQPWASLIVEGKKLIETRSWHTSYRGLIGIHAAMKCPIDGLSLMNIENRKLVFDVLGHKEETVNWKDTFPTGFILGYANLTDCILITEAISNFLKDKAAVEYTFGDFTPGRYAWIMEDAVKLDKPIPAKGKQRLWECGIDIEDVAEEALKGGGVE